MKLTKEQIETKMEEINERYKKLQALIKAEQKYLKIQKNKIRKLTEKINRN
jgi:hypothetical protein